MLKKDHYNKNEILMNADENLFRETFKKILSYICLLKQSLSEMQISADINKSTPFLFVE